MRFVTREGEGIYLLKDDEFDEPEMTRGKKKVFLDYVSKDYENYFSDMKRCFLDAEDVALFYHHDSDKDYLDDTQISTWIAGMDAFFFLASKNMCGEALSALMARDINWANRLGKQVYAILLDDVTERLGYYDISLDPENLIYPDNENDVPLDFSQGITKALKECFASEDISEEEIRSILQDIADECKERQKEEENERERHKQIILEKSQGGQDYTQADEDNAKKFVSFLADFGFPKANSEEIISAFKKHFITKPGIYGSNEMLGKLLSNKEWKDLMEGYKEFKSNTSAENQARFTDLCHKMMRSLWHGLDDIFDTEDHSGDWDRYPLTEAFKKYNQMYEELSEKIVGQQYAVNEFVRACFDADLYNLDKGPQSVFLFAGPPGVGKTFLAMTAAKILDRPFKVFDMGTYSEEKSDLGLIGSETLFKNTTEGTLTGYVEDHPHAVLLFDEIEKAHPNVIKIFLSILDGARLENKYTGSMTDFSDTMLIFTTNAGRELYENGKRNLSAIPVDLIMTELGKVKNYETGELIFSPEFRSRLSGNKVIMFNNLLIRDIVNIMVARMDKLSWDMGLRVRADISYDKRLPLLLLMHIGKFDARVATNRAAEFMRSAIYELAGQMVQDGRSYPSHIEFLIDDEKISDNARKFFEQTTQVNVFVACDKEHKDRFSGTNKNIKVSFFHSLSELYSLPDDASTFYLVDPYYKMKQTNDHILGLDDYDSEGLRIIKHLLKSNKKDNVFLLGTDREVSGNDLKTLYMKGVEGYLYLKDESFEQKLKDILADHVLQDKAQKLLDRHKVFDFESRYEIHEGGDRAKIILYDIKVKDAVNADDSKLLLDIDERPDVSFEDVIGAENAKKELKSFISFMENPKLYLKNTLGAPKGILLYGPPGTGKTMLARAMAGETNAAFISINAVDLLSGIVGEGEKNVKELFATARKYAPAIVFIDEIDSIGKKRTGMGGDSTLLNALLTEMDGFKQEPDAPVFVIAASNFGVDESNDPMDLSLDPALIRRFSNKILIDLPNSEERAKYLKLALRYDDKNGVANEVSEAEIESIAMRSTGKSIAILENVLQLGFRNALRAGKVLDDDILDASMEEYFYGEEREKNEEEIRKTSIHEASHAFIYNKSGKKPSYLSVISRGEFGGYMQREDERAYDTMTRDEYLWEIKCALAGRVGEKVFYGEAAALNTGAASDLRQASSMALAMITRYGMYQDHMVTLDPDKMVLSPVFSEYLVMAEKILKEQEEICMQLIVEGKDKVSKLADALFKRSHLNQEEIQEILG